MAIVMVAIVGAPSAFDLGSLPTHAMRQLVLGLALVVGVCGCNFVKWRAAAHDREFRRAALTEQTLTLGADRVHRWRGGTPSDHTTPVLLLHGFGGGARWQWGRQLPALTADRTVVVPDLLWFGDSTSTDPDPSLDHQAEAMRALLVHEGIDRVDVVGISYGGLVGYRLAQTHPELVRRLVLVDSPGPVYTAADLEALLTRYGEASIADLILPRDESDVQRLLELAYCDPRRPPRFIRRQVLQQLYTPHRAEQQRLLESLVEHRDRYAATTGVTADLGILWGANDPVFPLEIGQRLAATFDAPLHTLPRARHAPNLEHPDEFNTLMLRLLDE